MKVLMFGWELPPLYAGGIGMVCYDLIKELTAQGTQVTYIMPFGPRDFVSDTNSTVIIAENQVPQITGVIIEPVETLFSVYQSPEQYQVVAQKLSDIPFKDISEGQVRTSLYGPDLYSEVDRFAKRCFEIVQHTDFDVIHAHDWMTFPAAIAAKDISGKPLIMHIHNTIFDRYLGKASRRESDIEYNGLVRADKIIAISNYVKNTLVTKYGINPDKIEVIHNAPNSQLQTTVPQAAPKLGDDKIVLFTGRVTVQKGPEYFVQCAKKVLEKRSDVKFIMGGTGDMLHRTIQLTADLGIADKFLFTGFFSMKQAAALYSKADCYIMPSVSEPFGIVPLEAMQHGVPTIISRTSGCSEVLSHTLKVDFWDVQDMASKVLAILQYPALKETIGDLGRQQVRTMSWAVPAQKCNSLYTQLAYAR